jgi:hypothetical protein
MIKEICVLFPNTSAVVRVDGCIYIYIYIYVTLYVCMYVFYLFESGFYHVAQVGSNWWAQVIFLPQPSE